MVGKIGSSEPREEAVAIERRGHWRPGTGGLGKQ